MVGSESRSDHRLFLAVMLNSLSGFLVFPSWNFSDSEAYGMAFAVLAQLLTMARWFFVKAVLPKLYPASDRFAAIIVLAANMAVVASTALLELTTVLDFPGGQCPHVDTQATSMWPKQQHPLIHLHDPWTNPWVCKLFILGSASRQSLSHLNHRQGPLSCSDKMAQWSALGLGNLDLSAAFKRPLRLSSCTVGRKFSWPHAARALCYGYGIQHLDLLGCSVKLDDGVYEDCNVSGKP
eukprot:Skav216340  [mRNA]  locus=scaffold3350:401609:408598:- [translate_table: standard]